MPDRREVSVGPTRMSYLTAGPEDAPAMVLLHALGDQGAAWEPVLRGFSARYRVVAPDLRGHGQSDWSGDYAFEIYVDDVMGFLDALGLDRVTLVGHSMGGVIAYLVAIRQPERVERLVVEDVAPPRRRDRPLPDRPDEPLDFDWEVAPAIIGQVNRGEPDIWADLSGIGAPTLLIGGGPQSHIPQEQLEEVSERIPVCTMVTIAAGHNVHESQPEPFEQTVLEWLSATPNA